MALPKVFSRAQTWYSDPDRRGDILTRGAMGVLVTLAAALRFANLKALGYANHYYTAAMVSMLKSWPNFFYLAAEPGGSVSVDKPPVGLWIQAISVYFFGVNGFAVLLPEILAGVLSVLVLYHLVRRSFSPSAGLSAALALAITPVVVATDRNNTMDSLLILVLLLAAWAFIKATETGQLRYLLLGAALTGIGFNIKMLQAFLPLPAFYGLYLLGSAEGLWRKMGKLALATGLLLVVSLAWVAAVDLTPPDQRPYVGSSLDNSENSLIVGYNGMNRLLGMFGRRNGNAQAQRPGGFTRQPGGGQVPPSGQDANGRAGFQGGGGSFPSFRPGNNVGGFPGNRPGGNGNGSPSNSPSGNPDGFASGGAVSPAARGVSEIGQPGASRLLIPPLSKEVSWLLPLALLGGFLLLTSAHLRWPLRGGGKALVLWGGWLLVGGAFFSVAEFFHEYYLAMIAPPIAALVGIRVFQLWKLWEDHPWRACGLLLVAASATLGFQVWTARAFVSSLPWLPLALACLLGGGLLLAGAGLRGWNGRLAQAGLACSLAAVLIAPGFWSVLTTLNPSDNQSLPSAYSGLPAGPPDQGGLMVDEDLLAYLQTHTQGMEYLMAVPSSMQGSDYVVATGRPVLYLGGFMGLEEVVNAEELARMVDQGKLRYVYWNNRGWGGGGAADISSWVAASCQVVPGFDAITRNMGAPDGIGPAPNGGVNGLMGSLQVSLYDCGGQGLSSTP